MPARPAEETAAINDLRTLQRLIRVMSDVADATTLMRSLVLEVLPDMAARGAILAHLETSGDVIIVGSYGYAHDDLAASQRVSVWRPGPLADAVRFDKALSFATHQALGDAYPGLPGMNSAGESTVVMPVRNRGLVLGALAISYSAPGHIDIHAPVWASVTELMGWHLRQYAPVRSHTRTNPTPATTPKRLTARQISVLELMAQEFTNAQIAARLGYSSATIRADALHIYREFGVHSRHDAVRAARRAQIIPATPPG